MRQQSSAKNGVNLKQLPHEVGINKVLSAFQYDESFAVAAKAH